MSSERHPCIVPALDWLIGDPENFDPNPETKPEFRVLRESGTHFYIPVQYIDKLSKFHNEPHQSTRKDSAHRLLDSMGNMLMNSEEVKTDNGLICRYVCPDGVVMNFCDWEVTHSSSSTDAAIALAQVLEMQSRHDKTHNEVAIATGDVAMIAKGAAKRLKIKKAVPEIYTGRRKVKLPPDAISLWTRNRKRITAGEWANIFPDEPPLNPHEFVELEYPSTGQPANDFSNIGRFDSEMGEKGALVHLDHIKLHAPYNQIVPRTPLQAMYLEALMLSPEEAPFIIADCVYGSGKTFFTVLSGLYGVGYNVNQMGENVFPIDSFRYERIFVTPSEGALGNDIGFLPGDKNQKVIPKAMPIFDNLYELLSIIKPASKEDLMQKLESEVQKMQKENGGQRKKGGKKGKYANVIGPRRNAYIRKELDYLINEYFEFEPLINMCGRTISRSLISYDEAQNIEIWQMRELITRKGDSSKISIAGDTSQITKPHLSKASNGLTWIASRLAGSRTAVVLVDKSKESVVRDWAVREIIDLIGMY